ncbi:MAG: glycosyltransferase family 2 protein [Patescibacteria group bacterium]
MKIAIITLNYNGKKDTLEFLESLKKLKTVLPKADYLNLELKIVVVDNASSDGSVPAIHTQYPDADIIQAGSNLGYAGGYNRGLEYAQIWGADYFLIINNDTLINDENLLFELLNTFKKDNVGLVSPKIYFAKGFEFHKEKYQDEDLGRVIWFAGGEFDWDNIGSIHRGIDQVDNGQYDDISESEIISGACVFVKKEVLEKVAHSTSSGLKVFDEKYFLYFEDSDFTKRAKEAGFKTFYNGKTSIYHKVSQSTGIGSSLTDYYHTRNRLTFGMKYGRLKTKFALLREAIKLFIFGRRAQRMGISDYFLGVLGGKAELMEPASKVEYPLKLSIGIVNYNTANLTKNALDSIFKKGSGFDEKNMEVIVLDNGLIDPCKDFIKEYLLEIKYLQNRENAGFSGGYNKTIKYSLGQYYLMINSDVEVLKDGLSELIKFEDSQNGEAVLGGRLYFPDGTDQDSVFHLPTITGAFKEYFLGEKGTYFMYLPKVYKPLKVDGFAMACFFIPGKILNRVGLLDEGTFIFFEDIEYCRRLKKYGIPLYFVPSAKFSHHHGASTKKIGKKEAFGFLKKGAIHYHGLVYYSMLTFILWLGQKFGRVKTPVSRWTNK